MRRVLSVLAAALAAGCGYTGDPLPPLANIPAGVAGFTTTQVGNRIVAHVTVPKVTTEGYPLKGEVMLDLRIGPVPAPYREDVWEASATPVSEPAIENGNATYEIASVPWTGKEAALGVRVIGPNGKASGWSPLAVVPVVAPPETPRSLQAEATAAGVRLTWQAAGMDFRIQRRSGTQSFMPAGETAQPSWIDMTAEFGKPYVYRVETIVKLAGDREAESEPSAEVSITPQDKFPPAVPAGLRATAAPNSIQLSWDSDTEPDLAGYRVYRATGGGDFQKLADISTLPAYSDAAVEHGKTYRYAVSAVDQKGNESARSIVVEATLE